jgi:hypothetical protein
VKLASHVDELVVQVCCVYVHVKFCTLHSPLLHVAVADVHVLGHVADDVVYHVTLAPSSAVHHHGRSQGLLSHIPGSGISSHDNEL